MRVIRGSPSFSTIHHRERIAPASVFTAQKQSSNGVVVARPLAFPVRRAPASHVSPRRPTQRETARPVRSNPFGGTMRFLTSDGIRTLRGGLLALALLALTSGG